MGSLMDEIMGLYDSMKNDFAEERKKKRNFKNIRTYFDMEESDGYTIDDQTWDDFNMNDLFSKLDRTYSSVGESILYKILRNPLHNRKKLKERDEFIEGLRKDSDLRTKLQMIYFRLGYDKKNTFLDMIMESLEENKMKYYMYIFFGRVATIGTLVASILFNEPKLLLATFILIWVNVFINDKERKNVKSQGLLYLRNIIVSAKKIQKIKNPMIKEYNEKITEILKELKSLDKATKPIEIANAGGGALEVFTIPFLLEETAFYKIASLLEEKREYILDLYYLLGELESYISIASYKEQLKGNYSKPNFVDDININIVEGVHPLVNNAVPNSINFSKRGIVLTGTNMSGKSTFLRMIGLNMILAQTFNFTLTKKYEACFFNIVSSISPSDDVTAGKSYYMAEAEALLRIINALDLELPVFCPIDEIFRGTNPIERISSSAEILTYINSKKSISIVATHDRELTEILKENYDFFYFSEKVDSKGLNFDYKLKKGVSKTRNAIKLLDHIGYPKEIIKKSYNRAETLEKYM
ncbi:MutS domain V protein [Clostridium celatum DSM 1785]|uniref:MutS domain V protein n=2 Tax=Clostridium celatum TaxID=36834 RepID=L1QMI7_9CLOT|nr:MutS domain V protein [Clostridium celatum DSM 1785]